MDCDIKLGGIFSKLKHVSAGWNGTRLIPAVVGAEAGGSPGGSPSLMSASAISTTKMFLFLFGILMGDLGV